jgi:outer membrane protein
MNPLSIVMAAAALNGSVVTLQDAVGAATANQPAIHAARAATAAAAARVDEARAPLLPQIVAGASYQRTLVSGARDVAANSAAASSLSPSSPNQFSFGVTASQLVWDFGQTINTYRAAEQGADAQASTEDATRNASIGAARTAFFQALADKALVTVAQSSVDNDQKHLEQVQGFVTAGTRPPIDLAQAKADLANAKVLLATTQGNYDGAKATLNQAMGVERDTRYDVDGGALAPITGEDLAVDRLVDEALRTRPELAAMQKQLDAQSSIESAAKGSYGPSISVSTSFSANGPSPIDLTPSWTAMANVSWPLFTGFSTPAKVREAQANIQGLQANRDQLRQQVRADVQRASTGVATAKSAVDGSSEALTNADERLRLAEQRYQNGVGNVIELGDAQNAETAAAAQKIQATFGLSAARAALLQVLGRS